MGTFTLAIMSFLATALSLMGDTWRPKERWVKKLSKRGWVLFCIALAVVVINAIIEYDKIISDQYAKGIVYGHLYQPSINLFKSVMLGDESVGTSCKALIKAYKDVSGIMDQDRILLSVRLSTLSCIDQNFEELNFSIAVPIFHAVNEMCKSFEDLDCREFHEMNES